MKTDQLKAYTSLSVGLIALLNSTTALAQTYDGKGSPEFIPHTLQEALATAYLTNPTLRQERARLRATDEQVPSALAGWRPQIQGQAALTYYKGANIYGAQGPEPGSNFGTPAYSRTYSTPGYQGGVTITENIYTGGKTTAQTHQAVNTVLAERAQLIETEQQVFNDVVNVYLGVIRSEQILQININNEHVLEEQLKATQDRFQQGEITRTDVAQAQAALATAKATRQQSEGTLRAAQATYLQIVGVPPAPNLVAPQPLALPVKAEKDVVAEATRNNPQIINALFIEAQQKDNFSVQLAQIMPKISGTLGYSYIKNQGYGKMVTDNKYAMLNFNVPIYQGGAEYSAVRQARQQYLAARRATEIARRSAAQDASSNWQQFRAYNDSITSNRTAIAANVIALDGVERQAIVGTSSTLEVLQQQQTLLQAQTALVQNLAGLVQSSYAVAAAMGRLTAVDLKLDVPLYDEKAYYKAVKDRLWGINDYAVSQPGR
ncbi:TolC family outer membrane protein [Asaia bogorensis]|uniref:Type I secretion protein TolC n=1 Tax=Asaia bogorensis NBRC 16594 TaxID=1231624 RepID=A0AAN4R2V6_9PROT|nr:TolC family outer membrane protein [Asaia bogorensis]BAT19470.1 secretion system type I outer membrane protein TolC [Asaia bogorensis NBRC 16594]GBQ78721.1 secretion system type I outer membrane protein TolC [Asaia bogorensis NBRC 16594]GEL54036.1 type I secretion protein TolC [Asaia bogorensis NBRC 16594]